MNSPRRMNAGSESVPTRALPETPPFNARASASNVWLAARILSASASKRLPAAVSVIPVGVRSNNARSSSSSSALICADNAGWLMCSFSAARVRWPASATAAKLRRRLKSINGYIVANGRCNNELRVITSTDWRDSNKRLDFPWTSPYLAHIQCSKGNAMAEKRRSMQEVPVPDLLAALTAYGLGTSRLSPHAEQGARRSWLARCVERTFARDDARTARESPDLDSEWMGGRYARSRRLLDTALRAARQRKGVL